MNLNPCKCGRIPAIKALDVCEDQMFQAQCVCGRNANWWTSRDNCVNEWNTMNAMNATAQPVEPVQSKPIKAKPITHAMNVLLKAKEAYGCA